jgi:hypothetical protein
MTTTTTIHHTMEASSTATKLAHGGAVLGTDTLLIAVLSFLTPFDAVWCKEVCRWWHALLRRDRRLSAQIWRNEPSKLNLPVFSFDGTRKYWMYAHCVRYDYVDLLWYMWLRGPEKDRRHLYTCVYWYKDHWCKYTSPWDPPFENALKAQNLVRQWWYALYLGIFETGQKENLAELSARVIALRKRASRDARGGEE